MRNIYALIAGALFGIGLLLSGLTNTEKVQGWLDVFGDWDPTLAFVLGGAIAPMAVAWWLTTRLTTPMMGGAFPAKSRPELDRNLILGSTLFGAGWGLAGLCPGPAMASLGFGGLGGLVFLAAMAVGMYATPPIRRRLDAMA